MKRLVRFLNLWQYCTGEYDTMDSSPIDNPLEPGVCKLRHVFVSVYNACVHVISIHL